MDFRFWGGLTAAALILAIYFQVLAKDWPLAGLIVGAVVATGLANVAFYLIAGRWFWDEKK